jgi:Holliday junction resolvase
MSKYSKVKGSQWESNLEDYWNTEGFKARRLPRAGSKDIGDVVIDLGDKAIVVEAKNVASAWSQMLKFLREANVEADNYTDKYGVETFPVVATKTRQHGTGEGRIVMTIDQFNELLRALS